MDDDQLGMGDDIYVDFSKKKPKVDVWLPVSSSTSSKVLYVPQKAQKTGPSAGHRFSAEARSRGGQNRLAHDPERRKEIAQKAAQALWAKRRAK